MLCDKNASQAFLKIGEGGPLAVDEDDPSVTEAQQYRWQALLYGWEKRDGTAQRQTVLENNTRLPKFAFLFILLLPQ